MKAVLTNHVSTVHSKFKARWHVNELKPMIPARCIEIATNKGDVVLDPFGGGGSTFEAAERIERYWIGSEITDCSIIKSRFRRQFPQPNGSPDPTRLRRALVEADDTFSLLSPPLADHR